MTDQIISPPNTPLLLKGRKKRYIPPRPQLQAVFELITLIMPVWKLIEYQLHMFLFSFVFKKTYTTPTDTLDLCAQSIHTEMQNFLYQYGKTDKNKNQTIRLSQLYQANLVLEQSHWVQGKYSYAYSQAYFIALLEGIHGPSQIRKKLQSPGAWYLEEKYERERGKERLKLLSTVLLMQSEEMEKKKKLSIKFKSSIYSKLDKKTKLKY